jgi:hypothetical protein
MAQSTTVRWINRPVETVFAHIGDIAAYPSWIGAVSAVRIAPGRLRLGTTGLLEIGKKTFELQVTGYIEQRLLALEVCELDLVSRVKLICEPLSNGTRVTHISEALPNVLPNRGLGRIPTMRKVFDALVATLKGRLERIELPLYVLPQFVDRDTLGFSSQVHN